MLPSSRFLFLKFILTFVLTVQELTTAWVRVFKVEPKSTTGLSSNKKLPFPNFIVHWLRIHLPTIISFYCMPLSTTFFTVLLLKILKIFSKQPLKILKFFLHFFVKMLIKSFISNVTNFNSDWNVFPSISNNKSYFSYCSNQNFTECSSSNCDKLFNSL